MLKNNKNKLITQETNFNLVLKKYKSSSNKQGRRSQGGRGAVAPQVLSILTKKRGFQGKFQVWEHP